MTMTLLDEKPAKIKHLRRYWRLSAGIRLIFISAVFTLVACAPATYRYNEVSPAMPEDSRGASKKLDIRLYYYPKMGQKPEQQSRDHYECYNWAVQQTGFDPNDTALPVQGRVQVVPVPPPGHDTAALAVAGAIMGAIIGGPRHTLGGAAVGAVGGAMVGAASDASRQEAARQLEEAYARRNRPSDFDLERKGTDFRNAMSACLEGRGYSVK